MNTFQTKSFYGNPLAKQLFQQLFLFQIQLEDLRIHSLDEELEYKKLIQSIDELMTELIDSCDLGKS